MKTIDELGISPAPWMYSKYLGAILSDAHGVVCDDKMLADDARLIASAPELYEALFDCCEEVNGHDAPRCYGCRRGEDGHCMARGVCLIYKALAKASGEEVR